MFFDRNSLWHKNIKLIMRIFTEQRLKEYIKNNPKSKTALQEWIYVFNIKGNDYRLVVIIKFTIQFVYIRFVGTHKEYDKIKNIKNI